MNPRRAAVLASVVAVLAVLAALVAITHARPAATRLAASTDAKLVPAATAQQAPELVGVKDFDNTSPLTLTGLRGHVVLVDFWTYTCINCRRTFPFLRALQATYGGAKDFTVLGVHSPEFGFEKDHHNVARAVKELGVTWPVAEDPDMATWDAYSNQYWPADYLVDRQGRVRYLHYGEGGDAQIEAAVRALLDEGGTAPAGRVGDVPTAEKPGQGATTPETYFGGPRSASFVAGGVAVPAGRVVTRQDRDPGQDLLRLTGRFRGGAESLGLLSGARVEQRYRARDVYLTASAKQAVTLDVTLDGHPVPKGNRGRSLTVSGGRTVVTIGSDDLYTLLSGPGVGTGVLRLTALGDGAELFTTTYGG